LRDDLCLAEISRAEVTRQTVKTAMTVGKTRGNVLIPYDALGAHCEVSKLQACGIDGGLSIVIGSTLALPVTPLQRLELEPWRRRAAAARQSRPSPMVFTPV
jgi:hypothetical protein